MTINASQRICYHSEYLVEFKKKIPKKIFQELEPTCPRSAHIQLNQYTKGAYERPAHCFLITPPRARF
ncbi:Protein CBG26773 [Caenorhabditis briggsae]|uniref:Protein CBG26773 n=1 Tax=Caenorhabditis briggsae TaxID=6238 RepID=H8WH36_CAEBR|nr:Protein CBG26773 [Caenorhabditis briggsae]CCG58560.1 Protein CBG26773 [Caenorhabditis briggsae]